MTGSILILIVETINLLEAPLCEKWDGRFLIKAAESNNQHVGIFKVNNCLCQDAFKYLHKNIISWVENK